jgi:hypothetical protein
MRFPDRLFAAIIVPLAVRGGTAATAAVVTALVVMASVETIFWRSFAKWVPQY